MTKKAAILICVCEKPFIIFFFRTKRVLMEHQRLKFYKAFINYDPLLTLMYFTERSILSSMCLYGENVLVAYIKLIKYKSEFL